MLETDTKNTQSRNTNVWTHGVSNVWLQPKTLRGREQRVDRLNEEATFYFPLYKKC